MLQMQTLVGDMDEEGTSQKVDPSLVAQIVESYVAKNMIAVDELASLITTVHQALSRLGTAPPLAATALTPAVPIRRSVVGQGSDDFDHSARDMISRNRYILNLPDILSVGWYEPSLDHCLAVTSYVLKIFA